MHKNINQKSNFYGFIALFKFSPILCEAKSNFIFRIYLKKGRKKVFLHFNLGLFELSFKRNSNEFNCKHKGIKVKSGFVFISLKTVYFKF